MTKIMNNFKPILAVILSLSMVVCIFSVTAFADTTSAETSNDDLNQSTETGDETSDETSGVAVESIKFDQADYVLKIGSTVQASVTSGPEGTTLPNDFIFSVTPKNVVNISETGLIEAIAPGTASIMVISKSDSSLSDVANVTVIANVEYKLNDVPGSTEKLISGFDPETTVKNAKDGLTGFFAKNVTITTMNGSEAKDVDLISTGMNISVDGVNYKVVIKGDVSGDGKINYDDTRALVKYLSGESSYPNSAFIEAATIDGSYVDGDEPTLECSLKISRHVLKKYIINQ